MHHGHDGPSIGATSQSRKKNFKIHTQTPLWAVFMGWGAGNACMDDSYPLDHEQESDLERGDSHDSTDD